MSHRCCASFVLASVLALTVSACSSGGSFSRGGGQAAEGAARGTSTLIVRAELTDLTDRSLWEAINTLRSRWLRPQRGSTLTGPTYARVVVDGTVRLELDELHRLSSSNAETIRYLSAPEATIRYGTGYPGGVIEVTTIVGPEE